MSRPHKTWPHRSMYVANITRFTVLYTFEIDTSLNSAFKLLNSSRRQKSVFCFSFFFQDEAVFPWICLDLNYTKRLTEQSRLEPESTLRLWKRESSCLSLSPSFQRIWTLSMHLLPPLGKSCCLFPRRTSLWIFPWNCSRPQRQWEEKH